MTDEWDDAAELERDQDEWDRQDAELAQSPSEGRTMSDPADMSKESVAAVEAMLRATYDALRDGEEVRPSAVCGLCGEPWTKDHSDCRFVSDWVAVDDDPDPAR
jgi:hypothetical protein